MTRSWIWPVLWVVGGGCAREVAVDIAMTGESPLSIAMEYVELQHEDEGWIRVDLAPAVRRGSEPVVLATAQLPRGRYDALRVVYRATPSGRQVNEPRSGGLSAARPGLDDGPDAARRGAEEATLWRPFCVTSADDQIVLRLLPVDPVSGGTLQVDLRAPQC